MRQFVRWADAHGLAFWSELRLQHLQQYANEVAESGNLRSTINLKTRVVSMAAKWASLNWPEKCHDFTQGFLLPKGRDGNRHLRRDSLSLEEAKRWLCPKPIDLVVITNKRASYWKAFTRYRDKWRPGLNIEPNGLRRFLRSKWFKRRWHADSLAVYRGHKPPNASVVDWNRYIISDPDALHEMFREEVVSKIVEVLAPYRERWINSKSNVVKLDPDKKKA